MRALSSNNSTHPGSGDHRISTPDGRSNGSVHYDKTKLIPKNKETSTKPIVILMAIFGASVSLLCYIYFMFPQLDDAERQHVKVPFNIEDAKELAKVLDRYKDLYYVEVMGGIVLVYVL